MNKYQIETNSVHTCKRYNNLKKEFQYGAQNVIYSPSSLFTYISASEIFSNSRQNPLQCTDKAVSIVPIANNVFA